MNEQKVEIGEIEDFDMEYVRVNWQTQYLANNRYYFVESVYTTGNAVPQPIKFGVFNIETKKLEYLQAVPEAAGNQFSQVIYHENKLYLRMVDNQLLIFEDIES